MSLSEYQEQKDHLATVDSNESGIDFLAAYSLPATASTFWIRSLPPMLRRLRVAVSNSLVVHSGMAFDIRQPMLAWVNFLAWLYKKPTLFILDIDFRGDANRYLQLKKWSRLKYLANVLVLNPWRVAQIRAASIMCDLVLLKGGQLVEDYGRGLPHIKNFQDTTHSSQQVISGTKLDDRLNWLADKTPPFRICFFGRLVWKKGIDRMLSAAHLAQQSGLNIEVDLIGSGDCLESLKAQVSALNLTSRVTFHSQVKYGDELFELLSKAHLCIATPLIEDTPRAAFDAFARGLPILAFNTAYFRDLATDSNAVELASWPDPEDLARKIMDFSQDRAKLIEMAKRAVAYASSNTQEIWVHRRMEWTNELLLSNN